jgi:iron complex transport system permease protein
MSVKAHSLICVAALIVSVILSLAFGSRPISFSAFINGLTRSDAQLIEEIVVRRRIPRTILGLIAGASLGVAGALMQAVTRNPIADPGILGVNTGAAFAVVCGIAFLGINSLQQYIWLALCGSGFSAVIVYTIGSQGRGGATPIKLALSGAAYSAAVSSLTSAVLLPRASTLNSFRFWQIGGVGGATLDGMLTVAPFLAVGLVFGILSSPALNAIALGDDMAAALGVHVGRARIIGTASGVLLCGAVTAIAGPISFVGLMVPHCARLLAGSDQRKVIPLSAAGGAVLLTVSDVLGRLLGRPGELEVGVITAFIGAPVLIAIAMRSKVKNL